MRHAYGLPPIYTPTSRILILGTTPSEISEEKGEYYASPSNKFWKIFERYFQIEKNLNYNQKVQLLKNLDIAVWDLFSECDIENSKNKTISNEKPNDLQKELLDKANIELILLNGKDTLAMFEKHFKGITLPYKLVPHTSGANAANFDYASWFGAFDSLKLLNVQAAKCYVSLTHGWYKINQVGNAVTYVFDDYHFANVCATFGLSRQELEEALIKVIKDNKLSPQ